MRIPSCVIYQRLPTISAPEIVNRLEQFVLQRGGALLGADFVWKDSSNHLMLENRANAADCFSASARDRLETALFSLECLSSLQCDKFYSLSKLKLISLVAKPSCMLERDVLEEWEVVVNSGKLSYLEFARTESTSEDISDLNSALYRMHYDYCLDAVIAGRVDCFWSPRSSVYRRGEYIGSSLFLDEAITSGVLFTDTRTGKSQSLVIKVFRGKEPEYLGKCINGSNIIRVGDSNEELDQFEACK